MVLQGAERIRVQPVARRPSAANSSRYCRVPKSDSSRKPRSRSCAKTTGTFRPIPSNSPRHLDKRFEIFLLRRRVHRDVGIGIAGHAKIAAKARIDGGRRNPAAGESQILEHPSSQIRQAGIACIR